MAARNQDYNLNSAGETDCDSGPDVLEDRRQQIRQLVNAAMFAQRTTRRRRMCDRRRMARMEFRRNLRILRRSNELEHARRMSFLHQLVYLGHRNQDLRVRLNNVLDRAAYITELNDRLFRANQFLREQLNAINRHTYQVLSRPH